MLLQDADADMPGPISDPDYSRHSGMKTELMLLESYLEFDHVYYEITEWSETRGVAWPTKCDARVVCCDCTYPGVPAGDLRRWKQYVPQCNSPCHFKRMRQRDQ
jgi:hypothetical protein